MVTETQRQFLQTIDLFSALSPADMAQVVPLFHLHTFVPDTLLFQEGDDCQAFYIIAAGQVRLYETAVSGEEQTLFILRPRQYFDVIALVDDEPHPVTAAAVTDLRLYMTSRDTMLTLLHTYPAVADALLPHLSRMSRQLARLVSDLSFGTVANRLARFILLYAEEEGVRTPQGIRLSWGLSHREIAQFVGTAREVITRTLHKFETEGILDGRHGQLIIKDMDRLKQETLRR